MSVRRPLVVVPSFALVLAAVVLTACGEDPLPSLKVEPAEISVDMNTGVLLEATVDPMRAGDSIRWRSADSTLFRVDTVVAPGRAAYGLARRAGRTQIVVSARGQVVVVPVTVRCATTLAITMTGPFTLLAGDTARYATNIAVDGCTNAPIPVRWFTRDSSVATIDAAGLLTARAAGTTLVQVQRVAAPHVQAALALTVRARGTP